MSATQGKPPVPAAGTLGPATGTAADSGASDVGRSVWRQPDGRPVACEEKLAVLNDNIEEIRQACQDALEDAVLMGCDEVQVRTVLDGVVRGLRSPFGGRASGG